MENDTKGMHRNSEKGEAGKKFEIVKKTMISIKYALIGSLG